MGTVVLQNVWKHYGKVEAVKDLSLTCNDVNSRAWAFRMREKLDAANGCRPREGDARTIAIDWSGGQ